MTTRRAISGLGSQCTTRSGSRLTRPGDFVPRPEMSFRMSTGAASFSAWSPGPRIQAMAGQVVIELPSSEKRYAAGWS